MGGPPPGVARYPCLNDEAKAALLRAQQLLASAVSNWQAAIGQLEPLNRKAAAAQQHYGEVVKKLNEAALGGDVNATDALNFEKYKAANRLSEAKKAVKGAIQVVELHEREIAEYKRIIAYYRSLPPCPSGGRGRFYHSYAYCPPSGGGVILQPGIAAGGVMLSTKGNYESTGGQAPFDGDTETTGSFELAGGVDAWVCPPVRQGIQLGFGLNISGPSDGTDELLEIERHGPTGLVTLDYEREVAISALFMMRTPMGMFAGEAPSFLKIGAGPVFQHETLHIKSDQTLFGGRIESSSQTEWSVGFEAMLGLDFPVCPTCIRGSPLYVGPEVRFRTSPDLSVPLTSSSFDFTEIGTSDDSTETSITLRLSTPLAAPKR
jgi:hypothetical protein